VGDCVLVGVGLSVTDGVADNVAVSVDSDDNTAVMLELAVLTTVSDAIADTEGLVEIVTLAVDAPERDALEVSVPTKLSLPTDDEERTPVRDAEELPEADESDVTLALAHAVTPDEEELHALVVPLELKHALVDAVRESELDARAEMLLLELDVSVRDAAALFELDDEPLALRVGGVEDDEDGVARGEFDEDTDEEAVDTLVMLEMGVFEEKGDEDDDVEEKLVSDATGAVGECVDVAHGVRVLTAVSVVVDVATVEALMVNDTRSEKDTAVLMLGEGVVVVFNEMVVCIVVMGETDSESVGDGVIVRDTLIELVPVGGVVSVGVIERRDEGVTKTGDGDADAVSGIVREDDDENDVDVE